MCSACNSSWISSNRLVRAGALLLVLTAGAVAQDAGHQVDIRAMSPAVQAVAPGRILTLSFRVTQTTGSEETLVESLAVPTGWQVVIPPAPFFAASAAPTIRLLAVQAPTGAPAGRYEITYTVQSRRDPAVQARSTVTVTVLPAWKLGFLVEDKPEFVIAGQSYHAQLRLLNQGNAPVALTLSTRSADHGFTEHVEPATATVAAGQSLPVTLIGTTPRGVRRSLSHSVQVIAQSSATGQPPIEAFLAIEVIPVASGPSNLQRTLPTQLAFRLTADQDATRLQTVWEGEGSLDDTGTRRLDFLLQGPDAQGSGIYSCRDAYRLNLRTPGMTLRLGDQSYGLSTLTDCFHYGRGAGLDLRLDDRTTAGGFALRERWSTDRRESRGLYLSRNTDLGLFKVNYSSLADGVKDRHLWSLEGSMPCTGLLGRASHAKLETEVARSISEQANVPDGNAYRVELSGGDPRGVTYLLKTVQGGAHYTGQYQDSAHSSATVNVPLSGPWRGEVNYATWRQNLARNPARRTAPDERLLQTTLRYDLRNGWTAGLGYTDFHRRDRLQRDSREDEKPLSLLLARTTTVTSWNLELRSGRCENRETGARRQVNDLRAFASWQPSTRQCLTLYGGYRDDGRDSLLLGPSTHVGVR